MESKNSFQDLFFSLFTPVSLFKKEKDDENEKNTNAAILIQNWWRQNQWKRFYTIPRQFYLKRKIDEIDQDEIIENEIIEDEIIDHDTFDIYDTKSDYEDEIEDEIEEIIETEQESLINKYEQPVVNYNNFINYFFNNLFDFIYKGIKFMFGF
jgi:hypothetical protein